MQKKKCIPFSVHECLFCPQTFDNASAKDDHILEHFSQETCTECDQKLLRIGNNLYTLHNAVTCVKIVPKLEHNVCRSTKSTPSDVEQPAYDLWKYNEDSPKLDTDLDTEMTVEDHQIKIEATPYDEAEQFTFNNCDESSGSSDIPATSFFVKSTQVDDTSIEIDDTNEQTQEDANHSTHHNRSSFSILSGQKTDVGCSSKSSVFNTKCGICQKLFFNEVGLSMHMKSVHIISDGYECDICWKRVKTKNGLHIHKRYAHDETGIWKFKCKSCKASFMQESSLQQHKCGEKLKCELCEKSGFNSTFALKSHIAFKHRTGRNTINYVCKLCTRSFENAEQRDDHRMVCSYKRNIRVSKICGELWCDVCLSKFDNNSLLRKHIQSMHSDCQKFECNSCCAVFLMQSSYDNHFCTNPLKNRSNKKSERVSCQKCSKELCNRTALQKHNVFFHSLPGTLYCSLCAQTFKTPEELKTHRIDCVLKRKMQRYKRYECNLCDFIAKTQISLRDHITKNHKTSDA